MKKNKAEHYLRVIVLTTIMLVFSSVVFSQVENQNDYKKTNISLAVQDKPLGNILDTLSKMANIRFFFNHQQIDVSRKISLNVTSRPLDYVLSIIFGTSNVEAEFQTNRVIVLKLRQQAIGQHVIKVSGNVTDITTKEALIGASITMKEDRAYGVVTDENGKFFIEVPEGITALVISFIGYEDEIVAITNKTTNLNIKMTSKSYGIEDVVITGMSPRKTESFTGSYITVKGEDLKKLSPNNLLKALQFFDPSFRIVENNSRGSDPNTMPEFKMRGDVQLGATNANSMEILLGNYSNQPNMPLFILDGFEASLQRIVDLDPERVASITILKDASATAIYGSRAANGVVVFETKRPTDGVINISYSTNIGISVPDLTDYNLMNAEEKLQFEKEAGLFNPSNADQMNYYNHYRQEIARGVDSYWLSQPLRTAITHRHTLGIEGGTEAIRYNLNINYGSDPGVMKESDRTTLGLNFNLQYRRKKWNIGNQLSISNARGNNSPYGSFVSYTQMNPYYRIKDENGNYTKVIEMKNMGTGTQVAEIINPLYNTQFPNKDFSENFNVVDNLSIECSVLENLRLEFNASITKGSAKSEHFKSMNHTDFANESDITKRGSYSKSTGDILGWGLNASVNYNFTHDKHVLSIFGRWSVDESQNSSIGVNAKGFPNDHMTDLLFAYKIEDRLGGGESTSRSVGLIGQVSYMYDYRYSADFSVRGDISSQFGADSGMAPFWAAGVRWNADKEKWLSDSFVSSLVLRGSYGITGSQNYSPYQAKEMYTFSNLMFPYPSSDVLGAELMGIGNKDLGWSKTKNRSLSLDFGFFNDRLSGSFQYYNNLTEELLLDYTIAPSIGFSTIVQNAGSVENKGFDAQLSYFPIQNIEKQIQWVISVNGTHNVNKIKKISNVVAKMNEANLNRKDAPVPIYEEGKSTTQLFAVKSLGIDPNNGKEIFEKRDGSKTYVWDALDKVAFGDTEPKLTGSVSSSLTYKNFSVSLACSYECGAKRYNSTLVDKIENASIAHNLDKRALTDRWSPTNRDAKYKAISIIGQNTESSSRFIQKFNEFKFASISVGYRFDKKKYHFMEACNIASLSIDASMEDLGRISTIKQERGLDYPFARAFSISLSVLFN